MIKCKKKVKQNRNENNEFYNEVKQRHEFGTNFTETKSNKNVQQKKCIDVIIYALSVM